MNSIHITDWAGLLEWSFCFFAICLFAWAFLRERIIAVLRGLGWMRGPANREEIAHAIKVKERLMDLSKKPNGSGEWGKARLFGAWITGVLMTVVFTAALTVKHEKVIKSQQVEITSQRVEIEHLKAALAKQTEAPPDVSKIDLIRVAERVDDYSIWGWIENTNTGEWSKRFWNLCKPGPKW